MTTQDSPLQSFQYVGDIFFDALILQKVRLVYFFQRLVLFMIPSVLENLFTDN